MKQFNPHKGPTMKKVSVIYHKDCPDGKYAAFVAWMRLIKEGKVYTEEEVDFIPLQHGDPIPSDLAPILYILDFSFKRDVLEKLAEQADQINVIDHHKTAEENLKGLPYCTFNMDHSGATLSWMHFYPGKEIPKLLQYVEDRDLWRWKLPNSQEINHVLMLHIFSPFEKIDELFENTLENWEASSLALRSAGEAILAHVNYQVERSLQHVRFYDILGHYIPVVNTCLYQSETGSALCTAYPDAPFAALFWDRADGKRQFSLRSKNGFDVSEIAAYFGGGGHKDAAGFEINVGKIDKLG